ncbi:MAG: S41 family peptidase [Marinilabiliaceae bacterium]|nr:S41 family peptidase [Marinilabiliaceae bacterium]
MRFFCLSLLLVINILLTENGFTQKNDYSLKKVNLAWKIISNFYVDSINGDKMAGEAIKGMLKVLDPHSVYYPADEVKEMNEPLNGSFEGVGIQFMIYRDTLLVVQTIAGGPCEKVGVMPGDRIVKVDGENIAGIGLKNSTVLKMLKGLKGSKVTLSIKRKSETELLLFNIIRDKIPIFSVDASYMVTKKIGYIKINRFASTTYNEFFENLKSLKKQNANSLILDLRGNGGGYMQAAIDIADEFISNKKMIVFTQGKSSPRQNFWATSKGVFENEKVVVLIDEGSASASEIVSGAIQDWDRGVVIGRRSFGKGLVQRSFDFPDGALVRLTISKYYTPSGRCIQKPYDQGLDAYREEVIDRYKHGEMVNPDSIHINDLIVYKTLNKGRIVYGGGGIMPDLFVPADTLMYSNYYREIIRTGIINQFITSFVDENREMLKLNYHDFKKFEKEFEVSDKMLLSLIEKAEQNDVSFSENEFFTSKQLINTQLKALIARSLWSTTEYYQLINPLVNSYNEAIKVLSEPDLYFDLLK